MALYIFSISFAQTEDPNSDFCKVAFSSLDGLLHWEISEAQINTANKVVSRELLDQTLFLIPRNDGEAQRALEILQALKSRNILVSHQSWGAVLAKEDRLLHNSQLDNIEIEAFRKRGVKRIAIFEIPGKDTEEKLRASGFEVVVFDHHTYSNLDRSNKLSSLEQLMKFIQWPASKADLIFAVNDRSYIPGLKQMGLSDKEIRTVRRKDLIAQGRSEKQVDDSIKFARRLIKAGIPQRNGIYLLDGINADKNILRQELAIDSKDGLVDTIEFNGNSIRFSGDPKIERLLTEFPVEKYGYPPGSYDRYAGGDPNSSRFFGFKPKNDFSGSNNEIPASMMAKIWEQIWNLRYSAATDRKSMGNILKVATENTVEDPEVRAAGLLPRGAAIITSSGQLEKSGIREIIHAASGSMTYEGKSFDPSLKGVVEAIHNALILAKQSGHKRVAIPFIGGKIFLDSIGLTAQELADRIIDSAIKSRGDLELRFVPFGDFDTEIFKKSLARYESKLTPGEAAITPGSITDFNVHGASVIVNAANMEAQFGGGLSGVIAKATQNSKNIDIEAREAIKAFYLNRPR